MRVKLLTLAAVAALVLAGCETAPEESAATTGGGTTSGQTTTQSLAGPTAGSQEELLVEVGDRIFFAFDSSAIGEDQRSTVDRLAAWLKRNSQVRLMIEGHADERGTREYNLALGDRRANSVREYLVALGVEAGRINTISYGEERPEVLGSTENSWAQNRRAVFLVQ